MTAGRWRVALVSARHPINSLSSFGVFTAVWRTLSSTAAFGYVVFCAASIAFGQGTSGDVGKGLALAERLCVTCHVVRRDATNQQIIAGVPSFPTIANRPDQTADRVSGRIMAPHPPMPTLALTTAEIRDVAAYILSLRQGN
jgi:cytochrome c